MSTNINVLIPATGTSLVADVITSTTVASVQRVEVMCAADSGVLMALKAQNDLAIERSRHDYGKLKTYEGLLALGFSPAVDENGVVHPFDEVKDQIADYTPQGRGTSLVAMVGVGSNQREAYLARFEDAEIDGKKVPVVVFRIKASDADRQATQQNIADDRRAMAAAARLNRRVI